MRERALDVAVGGGLALALWLLYRISPEVGRTVQLVMSAVFLVAVVAHFVRRQQRH